MNEVLYEEDEEAEIEKGREEQKIPFTFRYIVSNYYNVRKLILRWSEDTCWDSMGILGLTSRMSRDTKKKQETFLRGTGGRKESLNTHQM